jgi:cell division septum initiation protein DivIVA
MRYTPVELRHVKFSRTLFGGYERAEADKLVEDVADSFEEVWRERGELADKLEDVEQMLADVKQREALLTSTLVAAEKTAAQAIEAAKREAEVIVAEAHQESRSIMRSAQNERERLFAEARRVETLLRSALGLVEETRNEPLAAAPAQDAVAWPNREHTREFQAVSESVQELPAPDAAPLPPVQEESEDDGPWAGRDFAWG